MQKFSKSYKLRNISKIFSSSYQSKVAFFRQNGEQITYEKTLERVKKVAAYLSERKISNKKIVLFMDSGFSFITSFFAIVISGNIPILVNNKLKEELQNITEISDFFLTDEKNKLSLINHTRNHEDNILVFNEGENAEISQDFISSFPKGAPFFYLFTSGSTGEPKLVKKSFENILEEIALLRKMLKVKSKDRFLALVPSFHIYGMLFSVLLPLYSGASIMLDVPFSPLAIFEDGLLDQEISILVGNPTQYGAMSSFTEQFNKNDFSHVRHILSSTMPLNPELSLLFSNYLDLNITEIYGSTETGGIAYRRFSESPYWTPFEYVRFKADENGLLSICSPAVSQENQRSWYTPGDIIRKKEGRKFELLGRSNRIIKIAGNRVSAVNVENILKKHEDIAEVVIVGESDTRLRGESLVAYVVLKNGEHALSAIKKYCAQQLPEFKVPKRFVPVRAIPKDPNGKILFRKLTDK
jgi:acyl-coenzyme A synthetase/AMP-(fatty) acid ligase